jgi:hypothetical protein
MADSVIDEMLATSSASQIVTVNTSNTGFLSAAPSRVAIIIQSPQTNRFTISLESTTVLDKGITVYPTGAPCTLSASLHGDAVTRAWSAISAVAPQDVYVIEVFRT